MHVCDICIYTSYIYIQLSSIHYVDCVRRIVNMSYKYHTIRPCHISIIQSTAAAAAAATAASFATAAAAAAAVRGMRPLPARLYSHGRGRGKGVRDIRPLKGLL